MFQKKTYEITQHKLENREENIKNKKKFKY